MQPLRFSAQIYRPRDLEEGKTCTEAKQVIQQRQSKDLILAKLPKPINTLKYYTFKKLAKITECVKY